jgi:hypothetical protein
MTEHQPTTGDDVEGYGFKRAFAEGDQAGDDVEGHGFRGSLVVEDREANDSRAIRSRPVATPERAATPTAMEATTSRVT